MGSKKKKEQVTGIVFHQEEFAPEIGDTQKVRNWLMSVIRQESRRLNALYYAFVDDAVLLDINQEHLGHDTYTDIITFPYASDPLEAEIYISAERVRANAIKYEVSVREEFLRVMVHGLLHLCGWDDHEESDIRMMRQREEACLLLFGIIPEDYSASPV